MRELNKYKKKKVIEGEILGISTYFWSVYVREFTKFNCPLSNDCSLVT